MKEYLVKATLVNNGVISKIDNYDSTNYEFALDYLMQSHRHNRFWEYTVIDPETQEVIFTTNYNKYYNKQPWRVFEN